uniref:Uncharacterized protein n=1 Tax=Rhizophora mucronata TaxID=61149 RepID=A0A2P2R3Q8_RHIMU
MLFLWPAEEDFGTEPQ